MSFVGQIGGETVFETREHDENREAHIIADQITNELIQENRDLDKVVQDFDNKDTWLRDISGLSEGERSRILQIGDQGQTRLTSADYALFQKTASFFHEGITMHRDKLQANAGWNFLFNAAGFVEAGFPWARKLEACFKERYGQSVQGLLDSLSQDSVRRQNAHELIAEIAENPRYAYNLGYYLAGRSAISEAYQEQLYGHELRASKQAALQQLLRLSQLTGLSAEARARAERQIQRTKFSGFDHLMGGVTVSDSKSLADYVGGTLRVEVKFSGTVANPNEAENPRHSLQHELAHSSSAQDVNQSIGLLVGSGRGRAVNEGMTEFLAQEAQGFPSIKTDQHGTIWVSPGASYAYEIAHMASLCTYEPQVFATLYKAYYGQIDNPAQLRTALKTYYERYSSVGPRIHLG